MSWGTLPALCICSETCVYSILPKPLTPGILDQLTAPGLLCHFQSHPNPMLWFVKHRHQLSPPMTLNSHHIFLILKYIIPSLLLHHYTHNLLHLSSSFITLHTHNTTHTTSITSKTELGLVKLPCSCTPSRSLLSVTCLCRFQCEFHITDLAGLQPKLTSSTIFLTVLAHSEYLCTLFWNACRWHPTPDSVSFLPRSCWQTDWC